MFWVSERTVEENLSVETSIRLAREAYLRLAKGEVASPERAWLLTKDGLSVYSMPSYIIGGRVVSVKIARLNPRNPNRALPSVQATIHAYDSTTGRELARVEAETLTALRTAASSAVATDLLARKNASVLGIFVTGKQAKALASYGDIMKPLKQGAIRKSQIRELGDLLLHPEKLNRSDEDVTLFKSGGVAALDGVAMEYLMSRLL